MTALRLIPWARRRMADESGFTLVELLTGMLVGSVVISAAVTLVLMSMNASTRVSDKVAGLSGGRVALAQVEQRLRSATCLTSTEYTVNGGAGPAAAANAILYAGPTGIVYLADISNQNGATNVTDSVGFLPYMRYLYVDQGATNQTAGRQGRLVDGYRVPTTTTQPYNYSLNPVTSPTDFTGFAAPAQANAVQPTSTRQILGLVTNAVSGTTLQPYFQYFNGPTDEITGGSPTTPLAYSQLDEIDHIRVNFRVLADSGKDSANNPGATSGATALDNRTVQFSDDIYLRVPSGACSDFF